MTPYCSLPQHADIVTSWNNYYPCISDKVRMGLTLTDPKLLISDVSALSHDFYYYSDEFSVIFDVLPCKDTGNVFMLVEGPHPDPTQGVRVPILSTWSHLKRHQHGETGTQKTFAFYRNRWWTIDKMDYTYPDIGSIGITGYANLHWCACSPFGYYYILGRIESYHQHLTTKHSFCPSADNFTLFNDCHHHPLFDMVQDLRQNPNKRFLNFIADFMEDECRDPFAGYIYDFITTRSKILNYKHWFLEELLHQCKFIELVSNYRAAKLLLLAEILRSNTSLDTK